MAKVKKTAAVTGVRNVKASKKRDPRKASVKATGRSSRGRTSVQAGTGKSRATTASKSKTKTRSVAKVKSISNARLKSAKPREEAPAPVVRVVVKPLEPQAKCGAGTSVQYLFRVDETVDGRASTHLVFFDRHGWYCEHGRNCPAGGHAKKYQGHIARAS